MSSIFHYPPKPQESTDHGGDFLIAAQSDFDNSTDLYCAPTSHAYCWKQNNVLRSRSKLQKFSSLKKISTLKIAIKFASLGQITLNKLLPTGLQKKLHCSHQTQTKHQKHATSSLKFVSQQHWLSKHYHEPIIIKVSQRSEQKLIYAYVYERKGEGKWGEKVRQTKTDWLVQEKCIPMYES